MDGVDCKSTQCSIRVPPELNLQGQRQSLTISGTGGSEIRKQSARVELTVSSLDGRFSSKVQANVLDNITGDTPAIRWSELKEKWPHLKAIPFEDVSRRRQIDVLIGSDHPVFHRIHREIHGSNVNDPVARLTNLGWYALVQPHLLRRLAILESTPLERTERPRLSKNTRIKRLMTSCVASGNLMRWE